MPSNSPFSVKISGLSDRHKVIFFGCTQRGLRMVTSLAVTSPMISMIVRFFI